MSAFRLLAASAALCCATALQGISVAAAAPSKIFYGAPLSAVWANDGADKVTQDETRATRNGTAVINSVWDGAKIKLFAAKNEVVSFNLILEAAAGVAPSVSVTLSNLTGPGGALIRSAGNRGPSELFNYTKTEAELFFVRYLQIKGLGGFTAGLYFGSEPSISEKLRLPLVNGTYAGGWVNRPNHDKFYPDIAVPMELVREFTIAKGNNQSVWADVYVPKASPAGTYTGLITVSQRGIVTRQTPVTLTVRNFTLPDSPSSKTMVFTDPSEIAQRYTGVTYPNPGTAEAALAARALANQRLLAHRHKISLIGDDANQSGDAPGADYLPVLSGALYTAPNGYAGPGVGTGSGVYSIATYGSWQSSWGASQAAINAHTNAWESWFAANFPAVERFLYLIDESTNYVQTQTWAHWIKINPGTGHNLPSFATINALAASQSVPDLSIATTAASTLAASPPAFRAAINAIHALEPQKRIYMYNGFRPNSGSFQIDDEGTSPREVSWAQFKKGIDRWFFWEATYYNDFQSGRGNIDLFSIAQTFGGVTTFDANYGMQGNNSSNGDGVLLYPGTDAIFPASSYGVAGPFASLRLKYWRRGIQDADYLTLAKAINPAAVQTLVQTMVPTVLWDIPVASIADPTYTFAPISWSNDPAVWEAARAQLAHIIDGQ